MNSSLVLAWLLAISAETVRSYLLNPTIASSRFPLRTFSSVIRSSNNNRPFTDKDSLLNIVQDFVTKYSVIRTELALMTVSTRDEISRRWLRDTFNKYGDTGYSSFLKKIYTATPESISLVKKDDVRSIEYEVGKIVNVNEVTNLLSASKDIICQDLIKDIIIFKKENTMVMLRAIFRLFYNNSSNI